MTDYANHHSVKDLKNPLNNFSSVDKFLQSNEFNNIEEGAFIFAPGLFMKDSEISWVNVHGWSDYFSKNGKKVVVSPSKTELINNYKKDERNIYYLNFGKNRINSDRYIALSLVNKNSIIDSIETNIKADSLTFFYYSPNKIFVLSFDSEIKTGIVDSFFVNGKKFTKTKESTKLKFRYQNYNEYFKPIKIKATNISVQNISVSDMLEEYQFDVEF